MPGSAHEAADGDEGTTGEQDGDFCFATGGELVLVGDVCATDRNDPDGGRGCGRAFSGLSSRRATTTALVRQLDFTADDVRLAVEGYVVAADMGPDVLGGEDFADVVTATVEDRVDLADRLPIGPAAGRGGQAAFAWSARRTFLPPVVIR